MSVQEIEKAIRELKPKEVAQLANWFTEFQAELWDRQIETDSKGGKLNSLIDEAKRDYDDGRTLPL